MSSDISTESLIKEARAFHLKKRLGQHFLVDVAALQLIADALDASAGDTVIEVGPGIGFLTRLLARTGARIVAVDLDRESIERLQKHSYKNTEIKHGDFLQFDLNSFTFRNRKNGSDGGVEDVPPRIKVVGNVPYQITGLIIGHLLGELNESSAWLNRIDNIVLTVQYEVAERMVAHAGESAYSKISILVQQYCRAEIIKKLPPEAFYPPPEVRSAVVKLVPLTEPAVKANNMTLMRQLVEAGFRQRRKMYRNALGFLHLPQTEIDAVFSKLGFDPQVRAERLSLQQFAMLSDAFDGMQQNAKAQGTRTSKDQSDI